ncbi:MAG: tetratricopeptide repeat protein [Bacteroidota bacterium]
MIRYFLLFIFLFLLLACDGDNPTTTDTTTTTQGDPLLAQIENVSAAIDQDIDNVELYRQRAALYYDLNSYDNAINDWQTVIEVDGSRPEDYHELADVYLDYFRSREALDIMEMAADKFPKNALTLLKLAEFQMILRKNSASFRTIDQLLKQDPQNAEAYFMMGMNFKETGDTARAINSFQEAVDRNSTLVDAWLQLGDLYTALGEELALQYYENAIRVAPQNVAPYHAKAFYLANVVDDLEGAIAVYEEINRIDPQYEDAYFNAGLVYLDLGNFEKARQQFDLTLKFSPTHIRAYFYRGLASEFLGNAAAAKQDYEQALRMKPDYELAREQLDGLE